MLDKYREMAKKRGASRKSTRKHRTMHRRRSHKHHRRQSRKRGGMAPVTYSLSGSWPSRMSLGQGVDYEQYHQGQHGGSAPYPASVDGRALISADMAPSAMTATLDRAIMDVRGLRDPPFDQMQPTQSGAGRRRKHHKKSKKSKKHHRKHRKHTRRMRGGTVLGFAPVSAPGMLLSSQRAYDAAGLNPDYRGAAVEYKVAEARDKA